MTQKDEDSDEIIANAQGVIWYKSYLFIKKKLGDLTDSILTDGSEVKIKVQLEYNEKYGMKLVIMDVDPSHTLGVHELSKRATFERLKKEGALELNKELNLPMVIQRIAIISSETAAGLEDFNSQLSTNAYAYRFKTELFPAAVQGRNMEAEFVRQFKEIEKRNESFDCVVVIRGGGSKLDLSGFDSYKISKEISRLSLPVITGIGHEIDQTISDLVSNISLKTPTAVANFIIDYNANFEGEIFHAWSEIKQDSQVKLLNAKENLSMFSARLDHISNNIINEHNRNIQETYKKIISVSTHQIDQIKIELKYASKILKNAHPTEILKRGFTIIHQGDKVISRKSALKPNTPFEIEFSDGKQKIKK